MLASAKAFRPGRVLKKFGRVREAWGKIDAEMKLHHYKIRNFQPHVAFSFERGHYIVKAAENGAELEECLKLRFNVFHREYMNKTRKTGIDIDKLDYICDHLMIFDKRSERIVGTYRLNSSLFSETFYSEGEFKMQRVLDLPGNKLELGRACIDREHRNGVIIALLWRGIAEYIRRTETKVLFGCASIKTMEPLEIGAIYKHLIESGVVDFSFHVSPTKKYKVKQLNKVMSYIESNPFQYDPEDVDKMIPALVHSYLKAGVKVCGEPALDREFRCIDFLIAVQVDEMSSSFKGKYNL